MATNRPHYHVWLMAAGDTAFFRRARSFHTRQAASQYAKRQCPDPARRMVIACRKWACRPKLD